MLRASVVVPVRNRPDLLSSALESLVAQDLEPGSYEIVVCDDGSSDDLGPAVARFGMGVGVVRVVRQEPLGPAAARNLGIRSSSAPIVIFVDSDVNVDRSLVRLLCDALDANPSWQGAEAALQPRGGGSGILWDAPSSAEGGRYHTAAIAYRREALVAVGGFDEDFLLPACEDVEVAIRILGRGPVGFVPAAQAFHPRRRVDMRTHWRWRRHWRYETILAVRYGILAFPGRSAGAWPRMRVAVAAAVTLPAGRLLAAVRAAPETPMAALRAGGYAVFDVFCGVWELPNILAATVPPRRDFLTRTGRGETRG